MKKICFALLLLPMLTHAQIITTISGNGIEASGGDGGPASAAELSIPSSVAIDRAGNIFITDPVDNCIREINTSGIINTIAGIAGTEGYSGDGGPATAAELYTPYGVAVDNSGNIYIADQGNNAVRKVNAAGIISTIAGTGSAGYSGDGGTGASAALNWPNAVAADDSGNVYIADLGNNCIRKVNASGTITTIAGNGFFGYGGDGGPATAAQLWEPYSVAVDNSGNIFISDFDDWHIRKINSSGIISSIAGNGTQGYSGDGESATAAELDEPTGVTVDREGNVYFNDASNYRVRKINPFGIISTIAGFGALGYSGDSGPAISAEISSATGVAVDNDGNVYIADTDNDRIRKVTNPSLTAENEITITSSSPIAYLAILNLVGEIVYARVGNTDRAEIDISAFVPGIYFLSVNGSVVKKFMKR